MMDWCLLVSLVERTRQVIKHCPTMVQGLYLLCNLSTATWANRSVCSSTKSMSLCSSSRRSAEHALFSVGKASRWKWLISITDDEGEMNESSQGESDDEVNNRRVSESFEGTGENTDGASPVGQSHLASHREHVDMQILVCRSHASQPTDQPDDSSRRLCDAGIWGCGWGWSENYYPHPHPHLTSFWKLTLYFRLRDVQLQSESLVQLYIRIMNFSKERL